MHFDEQGEGSEQKGNLISRVIATMSAVFAPFVYILAAAGLPGLLTTINAISPNDPKSFSGMLIGCGVSIIAAIILVQIIGCDEKKAESAGGAGSLQTAGTDGKGEGAPA